MRMNLKKQQEKEKQTWWQNIKKLETPFLSKDGLLLENQQIIQHKQYP